MNKDAAGFPRGIRGAAIVSNLARRSDAKEPTVAPMGELSDEALMGKVRLGELALLELLIARYERPLYNFALRVVGDSGMAQDAFQETFLRVYQKRATYKTEAPFRPWLYQICLNYCRDTLRKKTRRPESELKPELPLEDPTPGPESQTEVSETQARIRASIATLPDKQKEVFILHYYQGLPYPEIAEILDIPVGTVKSRMFTATRTLTDLLSDLR